MWPTRVWLRVFSVVFKKELRDCVKFVSYLNLRLPQVHNDSVFNYGLQRGGCCFENCQLMK